MKPYPLLKTLLAACLFSALPGHAAQPARPNLILIIADDLGTQLGCYGDKTARTPNIDKLAADGARFSNGHVTAASCSPSRGSMLTGLYPHQHGMMGLSHYGTERMHDDVPKLPNELKKLGYRTGLIGKTHFEPLKQFELDYYNEDLKKCIRDRDVLWMNLKAEEFITQTPKDQPFFLILSYIDPHRGDSDDGASYGPGRNLKFPRVKSGLPATPQTPAETPPFPFLGMDSPEIREEMADYYGAISRLDTGIGDLRSRLDAMGVWNNTMIVMVGDNGPDVTRGKMAVFESATRTPFIAAGRGVRPGTVRDELVSTIDIFPTFLKAAGAEKPTADRRQCGLPLQPLLQNESPAWRETLHTEFITHVPWHFFPRYTARDARHKLVWNLLGGKRENPLTPANYCNAWWESRKPRYAGTPIRAVYDRVENPPEVELFDLEKDPLEMTNLAENPEYREIRERLMADLERWREETGDPLLNPAFLAAQEKKGSDYKARHDNRAKRAKRAMH
jgi:N-sulfoglucosamine sulfohydrolase